MKEVLVPIDFTEDGMYALDYAVLMANHLKANLRLIHVQTEVVIAPAFVENKGDYLLEGNIGKWLDEVCQRIEHKYSVSGGVLDYKIREGNVVKEIANQAKYDDTTILVLGTHDDDHNGSKWLGSAAYRLVAHSPCPVIVINKRMQWKDLIKKVVVPIDTSVASRKKVTVVSGIAYLFKSKVYVVGLPTSSLRWVVERIDVYLKHVKKYLADYAGLEVETLDLYGKKLSDELMTYAETIDADLVTVHIHHSNNPFVNPFQSFTNDLINKSSKPVLVIPTKD